MDSESQFITIDCGQSQFDEAFSLSLLSSVVSILNKKNQVMQCHDFQVSQL